MNIINKFSEFNKLYERVSSVVYHFTFIENLIKIISDNRLKAAPSKYNSCENPFSKGKSYFISTTRSGKVGFASGDNDGSYIVKFKIDGDKINTKYSGYAMDYFLGTGNRNEMEDRILLNDPYINNFGLYVSELHIVIDPEYIERLFKRLGIHLYDFIDKIIEWCNENKIKLKLYENLKDFRIEKNQIELNKIKDILKELKKENNSQSITWGSSLEDYLIDYNGGLIFMVYVLSNPDGELDMNKAIMLSKKIFKGKKTAKLSEEDIKDIENTLSRINHYMESNVSFIIIDYVHDMNREINNHRKNNNSFFIKCVHDLNRLIKKMTPEDYVLKVLLEKVMTKNEDNK